MLIDTHCHLDAAEFNADRNDIALLALQQGVSNIVIPAVARNNFDTVIQICQQHKHCVYALGIHPMYVDDATLDDLETLKTYIVENNPVAIGEIGLDYFVTNYKNNPDHIEKQIHFFTEQLKIAKQHNLPVILHVRNAIDDILKYLRRYQLNGGIAHAFNGSFQQAEQLIALGFKLGFGGAMTYSRALKIRALASKLPLESIVLETDSPDIPPAWIGTEGRNTPLELSKIAQVLADLRQVNVAQVLDITSANALKVLPKLADLCTPPQVLL
ncbi:TatD family hydrolase [Methylotenera versatilis]|uniref:TatD-related deoxyribonuclease n=1 Tax=Methylotenera versatilis (strain 301) TaxID=666681 RepID=D7DQ93_METV0|nr:TatD family hydrolase [Methylotenera versatilis]ADI29464.1 TatD-related deoxyribonuclease [Methylotenera versatilis 301]